MRSRSKSKRNNHTRKIPASQCNYHSFHSLHHWYSTVYNRFGWMYLAKCKGIKSKVVMYKNSIDRLECSLNHSKNITVDPDLRNDLTVMNDNVAILRKAVHRLL